MELENKPPTEPTIESDAEEQRRMLKNPRIEAVLNALWATTEQDRQYLWRKVYPQFKPISMMKRKREVI